jgi:hypothetical protein
MQTNIGMVRQPVCLRQTLLVREIALGDGELKLVALDRYPQKLHEAQMPMDLGNSRWIAEKVGWMRTELSRSHEACGESRAEQGDKGIGIASVALHL